MLSLRPPGRRTSRALLSTSVGGNRSSELSALQKLARNARGVLGASPVYRMCCSSLRGRYPIGADRNRPQPEKLPPLPVGMRIGDGHHRGRHAERQKIDRFISSVKLLM